jgi:ribonuclease HI
MKTAPHYLLLTGSQQNLPGDVSKASQLTQPGLHPRGGSWHFVLEPIGHGSRIEADEIEPGITGERLNLLAVVRGIEALEQPSQVTLITPSKYVGRGIRSGIAFWREHNWHWERFGEMAPVKHDDLWKRIDRAMQIHKVDCRIWSMSGRSDKSSLSRSLRTMAIDTRLRSAHQSSANRMNNLAASTGVDLANDPSLSPYETPFASEARRAAVTRNSDQPRGRRKIVLTTERMNDPLADVADIQELQARHRKLFKATRKGWTRVTEIGPDTPAEERQAKAFGCSAN